MEQILYGKTDADYFIPRLNHYIDEHGDMHIAYRDVIIYGDDHPYDSTLGDFTSLSEHPHHPLTLNWDQAVLEMRSYDFPGAPQVPAGGVTDTWYLNDNTDSTWIYVAFAAAK